MFVCYFVSISGSSSSHMLHHPRPGDFSIPVESPAAMIYGVAGGPMSVPQQRTPMTFDMSPASSTSSSFYTSGRSVDPQMPSSVVTATTTAVGMDSCGLYSVLALTDSALAAFRDENFDGCTICVCNMNIDGADMGTLIAPGAGHASRDEQFPCTCAFSAVVNRRRAQGSGLFYEDEIEITGIRYDAFDGRKPSLFPAVRNQPQPSQPRLIPEQPDTSLPDGALTLLRQQLSSLYPTCALVPTRTAAPFYLGMTELERRDSNEACIGSLEFARHLALTIDGNGGANQLLRLDSHVQLLHPWLVHQNSAQIVYNSTEVVQLLKSLQPLLQDAIQKKRSARLWESVYTISGPLTWRDFHLMAGRGTEETSEPKPVPSLLVGYDRDDWLTVSPHSVKQWDTLLLEPFCRPHNVVYVIVAPENDYLLNEANAFFQQLSVIYEQCHLGTHRPINDKLRDGVMRVGRVNAQRAGVDDLQQFDSWFRDIGNSQMAVRLRLYAAICCKLLGI